MVEALEATGFAPMELIFSNDPTEQNRYSLNEDKIPAPTEQTLDQSRRDDTFVTKETTKSPSSVGVKQKK